MGETVVDGGAIPPPPPPEGDSAAEAARLLKKRGRRYGTDLSALEDIPPPPVPDLNFGRDALDDTVADTPAAGPADDDVHLDRIFDRPDSLVSDASLSRYDPEAGKMNVAIKVKAVSQAVRNTLKSPFGKVLVAIPVFLAGLSLVIAAVTFQTWPWAAAAAVVFPIGALLVYLRYQAWLGHKRYMYRLLESLGEDVSDFDPRAVYRKTGTRAMKRQ
jgi:hypothetical protein